MKPCGLKSRAFRDFRVEITVLSIVAERVVAHSQIAP